MKAPSSSSRLRAHATILVVGVGIMAMVLIRTRGKEGTAPAPPADRPIESRAASLPPPKASEPDVETSPVRSAIMPLDSQTLSAFQEANSRATHQLSADNPGAAYAVTASLSARQAIANRGHDPDRTVQYWLSPQFAADVAAGDPAFAVSNQRTIANLLSVILGDQAGNEDFEQILTGLSPEVRELAIQRRARP